MYSVYLSHIFIKFFYPFIEFYIEFSINSIAVRISHIPFIFIYILFKEFLIELSMLCDTQFQ